jgi:hypothetical protein
MKGRSSRRDDHPDLRRRSGRRSVVAVVVVAVGLVAGCGGSSEKVVRPPVTSAAPTPSPTPTAAPTMTASRLPGRPVAAVTPATGLVEGQSVAVTGSSFSPGLALVVVQCLDRGKATGSGDCNLPALVSVTADAGGKVATRLKVSKGPFGTPPLLCSATHRCLVSITEATLSPTEEADAAISFR